MRALLAVAIISLVLGACTSVPQRPADRADDAIPACKAAGFQPYTDDWSVCIKRVMAPSGVRDDPSAVQAKSPDWDRVMDALLKGAAIMGAYQAAQPAPPPPPRTVICRAWPPGGNTVVCN